MTIAHILKRKGTTIMGVSPDHSLQEAAAILTDKRVGALVVLDSDGHLEGILSERDIVRLCARSGAAAMTAKVADAMTKDVLTAAPKDKVDSALARMTDRRIRHLPVLDGQNLVGVVSIGDLVKAKIDEALQEADAMRAYIATG
ncbi:CBS domain-containing protein [Aquidulcibacter sp.]|jgi:CBS domain-containing protein|uniref:CBS domain-containing protein n=1 Tax=Aquidulcibacter sp. TaxID=2052990 RepID=UPI003BA57166